MHLFSSILEFIESLAHQVPIEAFVLVGSFIEEVVAPIPSPLVMMLAGSLAQAQNQQWWYLIWLSAIGAFGKTLGAWILYIIADKLEDLVIGRFGKFLGFSHKEVENIGKRLNGGWQDNVILFIMRALPIMPSAPVSLACGAIKLNLKTYLSSTFFGTMVRNLIYLYLGFAGFGNYEQIVDGFESVESIAQILIFLLVGGVVVWAYYRRRKMGETTRISDSGK